jgi:hypothetical protein
VVQYANATGTTQLIIWGVIIVLLGVLAWAIMRSKADAPAMK